MGSRSEHQVLVIGGSLAGLTFALACATRGIRTCVLDRGHEPGQTGGALGIDRFLLSKAIGATFNTGSSSTTFPTLTNYRQALSWRALYEWLHTQACQQPQILLVNGTRIAEVMQRPAFATAATTRGERFDAQVIVGADGYRSVVRSRIDMQRPSASYAGYLLWRGLIAETSLPADTQWPSTDDGVALQNEAGYRLVAYPVAGENGSLVPGKRLISFAWYDKTRDELLRNTGCISASGHVLSSLPPGGVPAWVSNELKQLAMRIWPEPWRSVIASALERRQVFATPVAEYFPERLCHGRLTMMGDAAHVVSPATGMGFTAGLQDAQVLADCLGENLGQGEDDVSRALGEYEKRRLPAAQQLVTSSLEWSRAFVNREHASFGG